MKYLKMILSKEFWPEKEIKNQCVHIVVAEVIALIMFLVSGVLAGILSVVCFGICIESYQYFKARSLEKLIDCLRDFIFYLIGACIMFLI